jgi:hypothetical protein
MGYGISGVSGPTIMGRLSRERGAIGAAERVVALLSEEVSSDMTFYRFVLWSTKVGFAAAV